MLKIEEVPELRGNINIAALMYQLEGTENRVMIDRDHFLEVAAIIPNTN